MPKRKLPFLARAFHSRNTPRPARTDYRTLGARLVKLKQKHFECDTAIEQVNEELETLFKNQSGLWSRLSKASPAEMRKLKIENQAYNLKIRLLNRKGKNLLARRDAFRMEISDLRGEMNAQLQPVKPRIKKPQNR